MVQGQSQDHAAVLLWRIAEGRRVPQYEGDPIGYLWRAVWGDHPGCRGSETGGQPMIWRWLFAMLIVLGSLGLGLAVILTDWGKILAFGLMIIVIICVVK